MQRDASLTSWAARATEKWSEKKKLSLIIGSLNVTLLLAKNNKNLFHSLSFGFDVLALWLSYNLQTNKPTAPRVCYVHTELV